LSEHLRTPSLVPASITVVRALSASA
jgi:hypothetical protein